MLLFAYIYVFWLLFIVTMAGKAAWPHLQPVARVLIAPAALAAYVMDVLFNIFIATLLFLDLPREWTFTERLERYKAEGGWRAGLARWICSNLLDPFQVGGHCH
jgi:hypothetical protein